MLTNFLSLPKRLLETIHLLPIAVNETERALLDEVIPPTLTEKSLPLLAMVTSALGFAAMVSFAPIAHNFILLGPVLLLLYQYIRTDRQEKAKKRSYSDLRVLPTELVSLEKSLRKHQHHAHHHLNV